MTQSLLTSFDSFVAIDIETTGLNPEADEIIEIAAVRFSGDDVEETFSTLVKPRKRLPEEIRRRTGLSDAHLSTAPAFAKVADRLGDLISGYPLVGHNVDFALSFLAEGGVHPMAASIDTIDLASVLLPKAADYSLPALSRALDLPAPKAGRADAEATRRLFLALNERLNRLDPGVLGALTQIAARAGWRLLPLLRRAETRQQGTQVPRRAGVGLLGVDPAELGRRAGRARSLMSRSAPPLDPDALARLLEPGGPLAQVLPGYEHRPQQAEMLHAVAAALGEGHHLVVEGGTGIGKTVAYLVPAIVFAATTGQRVVVSTNTINLQEQLVQRDIPALVRALEQVGAIPRGEFKAVQIKGRANYLCLQRWSQMSRGEGGIGPAEARLLGRTLMWLQETSTGDRGELRLPGREAAMWSRMSADQGRCMMGEQQSFCFVRSAREQADSAHLVVVNHALLLTDLAMGGNVVPKYERLIIDEAHHLEDGATRQFGFELGQNTLDTLLDRLTKALDPIRIVLRGQLMKPERRREGEEVLGAMDAHLPALRAAWAQFWGKTSALLLERASENPSDRGFQSRLTTAARSDSAWTAVEVAWEHADLALKEMSERVDQVARLLRALKGETPDDFDQSIADLTDWLVDLDETTEHLRESVPSPDPSKVYWLAQSERGASRDSLMLAAAPLHVGPVLYEHLFNKVDSVVLTSATLATGGSFKHLRERVGLQDADELLVGSPFDYKRAAVLLAPLDIPDPDRPGYAQALLHAVTTMAGALGGHTMVLFTSYASLQGAARSLRGALPGIRVLAQGVDGTPQQLVEAFQTNPKSVLLGTASFWEGVDLPSGVLKCLVLAKLPFTVPTEPVFAARSEQYEQPFSEYAIPQAVLRFRQGFGRLVRRKDDRGVVLVMDRRLLTKGYGGTFVKSLPTLTVQRGPLERLLAEGVAWLKVSAVESPT